MNLSDQGSKTDSQSHSRGGCRLYERYNCPSREGTDEKMALKKIPTVDDLVETTGQSKEQLLKDREAAAKMSSSSDDE